MLLEEKYIEASENEKLRRRMKRKNGKTYRWFAHRLDNAMQGSIILDIDEVSVEQFMSWNKQDLENGKKSCWPACFESIEALSKILTDGKYKYYILYASYGMRGWIISKDYICYLE